MNMNFTSINTQYNPEVISAIAKENTNSAKSNISSVYDSKSMNIDAAVLSISGKGSARISAMMSKSIQLRASASNPELSAADRLKVNSELKELRREMNAIESKTTKTASVNRPAATTADVDTEADDVEVNVEDNMQNILKKAEESIMVQNMNREHVLQLL